MLNCLNLSNLAVIKQLSVDFQKRFTAITGETGAGKTVLITGLNLLLGAKADRELIRRGETEAEVSALFSELSPGTLAALGEVGAAPDENGELLLSRTMHSDGKSAARVNGKAVSISVLKRISACLFDIHGQSANRDLADDDAERELLDELALAPELVAEYRAAYGAYTETRERIRALEFDEREKARTESLLRHELKEIDSAKLKDGEEDELFDRKITLKHAGRIQKQLSFAYRALQGGEKANAVYVVDRAIAALRSIEDVCQGAGGIADELMECMDQLEEISDRVESLLPETVEDPDAALDRIESRLSQIEHLKRKYGSSVAEILRYADEARAKLDLYDNADSLRRELEKQAQMQLAEVLRIGSEISEKRRQKSFELSAKVTETLHFLDMPKAVFEIRVSMRSENGAPAPDSTGVDDVAFLLSANLGEAMLPIQKAASGGELARIMLAIRSHMCTERSLETVIYDEVDTGVSGKTARKIGLALSELASSAQILCITHSAQIASLANSHLLVRKTEQGGRVESTASYLNREARVEELARILGGLQVTEAQRAAAIDMLTHSN